MHERNTEHSKNVPFSKSEYSGNDTKIDLVELYVFNYLVFWRPLWQQKGRCKVAWDLRCVFFDMPGSEGGYEDLPHNQ